jgi:hypothetical protein
MRACLLTLALCGCQAASWGDARGRVIIDGADSNDGVTVRAIGPITVTTETNSDGDYQLSGLPSGEYALWLVAADTLEETRLERAQIAGGQSVLPEVRFTAVGTIDGEVRLGSGVGGGAVVFVDGACALATSDAAGRYHIEKVPAGLRTVEAVLSGYRPGKLSGVSVTRGQIAAAPALTLEPDDGAPYPVASLAGVAKRLDRDDHSGTTVTAIRGMTRLTTTTAKDGSYRFDGLPTGLYRLELEYDGRSEAIPQVLALAGSTGQVVDGALFPLETHPLQLFEATRLSDKVQLHHVIDSQRLLVSEVGGIDRNDQTLALLALPGGALTTLTSDSNRSGGLLLSNQHERILYTAGIDSYRGALRTVGFGGDAPLTLAPLVDGGFRFSLDDTWALYRVQNELRSVPITGGSEIILGAATDEGRLHPDGKRVVFQTCDPGCRLVARTLDGGPLTEISLGTGPSFLSPDGNWVLHVVQHDYNTSIGQLRLAKVDGSASRIVWDGQFSPYYVSFSPDSQHAALITDGSDLRILALGGDAAPAFAAAKVASLSFTSDGSRLIYLRDYQMGPRTFTLEQQPTAGGAPVVLGDRVEQFVVSRDGTRTLFVDAIDAATRSGALRVASATGQVTTLVAADVMQPIRFTNDGKRALYHTLHPTRDDVTRLFSVSITGGAPVELADAVQWTSQDSPGGINVSWMGGDQVVRVAPATGGVPRAVGTGYVAWVSDTRLVLTVTSVLAPFRHQNGLYVFEVTP